uniref:HAT C-terminal dimerisation domain-containing protein n=1 Tax=Amphiprion ocellaris TaxID=80972 RepID=A0A3Q1B1H2_AMPOC
MLFAAELSLHSNHSHTDIWVISLPSLAGVVHADLKLFLETNLPLSGKKKPSLGVSDAKIGAALQEEFNISIQTGGVVAEITRGVRLHFHSLVKGLTALAASKAQLGLGHSYSRAKVKFNVNRADNMIIQSIALLDQLDKDINTFSMRVRAKKVRSSSVDGSVTKPATCTPQQANVLTKSILNMLVTDMRPLSMVDDEGFKEMIKQFNPDYHDNYLPDRSHFTTLMETKYHATFEKVKETLRGINSFLTLTADVWTSHATEAYLEVSCHFLSEDWTMKTFNLSTMPLEEWHTGANIMTWMEEVLAKFDILPTKIKAVVHDSGSNMVAAMRLLEEKHGWASIGCAGHTLQLIVNTALKETTISRALGAARQLVEHFKRSELASTKLEMKREQMMVEQNALIQDVGTRWNSTFYMIERLLEQRWPLTATLLDPEVTPKGKHYFDLKPEQWELLEELKQGLAPFETATVYLSGQQYTTISGLPQVVKELTQAVHQSQFETSSGKSFISSAEKGLTERWGSICTISGDNESPVLLAAALDPRYRKLKFLTPEDGIRLQGSIEVLAVKEAKTTGTQDAKLQRANGSGRKSALETLLQSDTDSFSENEGGESEEDRKIQVVMNEVRLYFGEASLPEKEDPLRWWSENEERFPTLSKLAKSFLCIPATSTPSEQIFSAAGNICSQKRASLCPRHVEMLTFLAMNKSLMQFGII